jgi:hydrogenase maturation protein HypF
MVLRRARGYAPLPIEAHSGIGDPVLAVGAHLKNTVALSDERQVFLSQHIGDLETGAAHDAFRQVTADMQSILQKHAARVVCDLHPDYLSSQFAAESLLPLTRVQHHIAHVASCMADNQLGDDVLGVSWDGTGFGMDGTVWGGEFFAVEHRSVQRVATFRSFMLPGGEAAILEPRRAALGLMYELSDARQGVQTDLSPVRAFTEEEREVVSGMLRRELNAPRTSSVGRLFDAVASLLGIRQRIDFEGQAAMELEFCAAPEGDVGYPFEIIHADGDETDGHPLRLDTIDWAPMIARIVEDQKKGLGTAQISRQFHNTLASVIVTIARRNPFRRVVLSGGCFQNRLLTELTVRALREAGFQPYWHQRVPPNDGGISLGQIVAAGWNTPDMTMRIRDHATEETGELVA